MSYQGDYKARNRRLRNLAVLWVLGSFAVAILIAAILYVSNKNRPSTAQEPTPPPAQPTAPVLAHELAAPQVVTAAPEGDASSAAGQPESVRTLVSVDAFGYGIQLHGSVGDPELAAVQAEELGMGWIKQQVRWGDLELSPGDLNWGMIDGIMVAAQQHKLRVMLSVVTAPVWTRPDTGNTHGPPDDLNQYTAFVGKLIDQYPGQISAIEVWNEQNLAREWDSTQGLQANRYLDLLKMSYETIKAKDASIVVISGALSPTGGWVEPDGRVTAIDDFSYFQQLLDSGLVNYTDCVGAHHNGYNIGPDVTAEDAPNQPEAATAEFRGPFENVHHSWSFKSTLWGYHNMMAGQKKLCVTEFGWASTEGVGGTPPGFAFANDNSEQNQASYITQAFQFQRDWEITWLAFLWNLDYGPKGLGPEDNNVPYSILNMDGTSRPAYDALAGMPKP